MTDNEIMRSRRRKGHRKGARTMNAISSIPPRITRATSAGKRA
jgi:hypothetical protein